jgi:preprotein translocase subunit SecA
MFTAMMDGIKEDSVGSLFNLQVQVQENPIVAQDGAAPAGPVISVAQAAAPAAPTGVAPPAVTPQGGSPRQPAQPAQAGGKAAQPARRASQPAAAAAADDEAALPAGLARGLARPQRQGNLSYSAPSDDASGRAQHSTGSATDGNYANVGRNAPCPCGSGKKFKQCHGDPRNR